MDLLSLVWNLCKKWIYPNWEAISTIFAGLACSISMHQISAERKLSNKQSLFEKRVDIIVLFSKLIKCKDNSAMFFAKNEDNDNIYFDWGMATNYLLSTGELHEVYAAYSNPDDDSEKRKLLIAIQELGDIGYKVKLLFPESIGAKLYDFFLIYGELLMSIYRYRTGIQHLERTEEKLCPKSYRKVLAIVKNEYNEVLSQWDRLQTVAESIKIENLDECTKLV